MKARTVEELLQEQIATCLAAMQDCLGQSRQARADDADGWVRRHDVEYVAKLLKASARLTGALAQLRGERRQEIHVRRSVEQLVDRGRG